jgi:hypothetical protein
MVIATKRLKPGFWSMGANLLRRVLWQEEEKSSGKDYWRMINN